MPTGRWLLAGIFLVITSCVSVADLPKPVSITAPLPEDARSLSIAVAPSKPGVIKNAGGLANPEPVLAGYVRDALKAKRPAWEIVILEGTLPTVDTDLFASAEILSVDGGSAGLRFWIGFSAGASESTAAVSLFARGAKPLAQVTITERTMCPLGACVDSNEDNIQRNLKNLAAEIAAFITDPAGYKKDK
jgi:uncharacterized protein DUF4410